MAGVRFEKVCKIYFDKQKKTNVTAVHSFDLEIQDKEFLVLVGPSGCGKTTTLRMIAGLEEISQGKLFIGDKLVNDIPSKDRDIAMVFQNYALYPHLTVRDNLGFSLKLRGVDGKEIDRKVKEVSEILRLDKLLDRRPNQLSGGQAQRVAIGRAIVRNPKVFLFDEPLSNLDAKMRVEMRVELAKLHKALNTTIVYVTHDQIEAMTLADRIVVMKDGFIQQVGSPLSLYHKPANSFVAGFIGSPAMNQVQAKIELQSDHVKIIGHNFQIPISGEQAKALRTYASTNTEILLGIRPEDLTPTNQPGNRPYISRILDVIEPIGNESYAYFAIQPDIEKTWVARCEGTTSLQEGQLTSLVINLDHIHIFSADGSQRIA